GLSASNAGHVYRLSRLVDDGELQLADLKRFDEDLGSAVEQALAHKDAMVYAD
ncbi:MAG: hypothetical protein ACI9MC_000865, partial [Kiritimatiellia bacterium]